MSSLLMLTDLLHGVSDSVDFDCQASILAGLFDEVVQPNVFQTHDSKVDLQQVFSVTVSSLSISANELLLGIEMLIAYIHILYRHANSDGRKSQDYKPPVPARYFLRFRNTFAVGHPGSIVYCTEKRCL